MPSPIPKATRKQREYLDILGDPDCNDPNLTKYEASKRIDKLADERRSEAWGVWGDITE